MEGEAQPIDGREVLAPRITVVGPGPRSKTPHLAAGVGGWTLEKLAAPGSLYLTAARRCGGGRPTALGGRLIVPGDLRTYRR